MALGVSLVLASAAAGCGAKVVVDETSGGGGFGGAGGASSSSSFSNSVSSSSGIMTSSATGTTPCDPSSGQADALPRVHQARRERGLPRHGLGGARPSRRASTFCSCLYSVDAGPKSDPSGNGLCCYDATIIVMCVEGRALRSEDGPVVASVEAARRGWSEESVSPALDGLSAEARALLASRWVRGGLFEHASVASFSRLALALLAASADAELVRAAHEAALDEVRHAKLSFSLASAYEGAPIAPSALPLAAALPVESDLVELAVSSVIDGAVGETLAAALAAEQAATATDPAVRRVLEGIADDEGRHAELAFKVIAFAIASGGERVREAVSRAFAEVSRRLPEPPPELPLDPAIASAHGHIARERAREVFVRAMDDVVLPLGRALVGEVAVS